MKKIEIHEPSKLTMLYFRFAMLLTIATALALLVCYLQARAADPIAARIQYPATLEYIAVSPCIALFGAILLEAVQEDIKSKLA